MVLDTSRDSSLVQDLMDFKSRLDEIVSKCFNNNEKFIQVIVVTMHHNQFGDGWFRLKKTRSPISYALPLIQESWQS